MALSGKSLVFAMCIGQVGNLLPHVVVPAVMVKHLIPLWQLSSAQAGLMASSYAIGYMIAVPLLATLTDRIDARIVLGVGSACSALATLAFGLFADGLLSAILFWSIAGVSFAGAYMPGLKALTDRLPEGDTSRAVTFYTASYSVGVGASFLVSQLAADAFGWRYAFAIAALGPIAMLVVCLRMAGHTPQAMHSRLFDFAPVVKNRQALGYILGYGAHCFELYGIRTWIVAFWTYVAMRGDGGPLFSPVAVSVVFTVLAMPSSLLGNELALRFGRHRALSAIMIGSALLALIIGLNAGASPWLLLPLVIAYTFTVSADSGALTAGMAAAAAPAYRGATMALHSTVGFGMSALGAWGMGAALDAGGGSDRASGWLAAFCVLACGIALGPLALWWSRRLVARA